MLGQLKSESAKLEALKEIIRMRVIGLGWKQFAITWSYKGAQRLVSELAAHLKMIIREEKKSMGRAAMLKEVTARATVNRDVGGSDRGMSLATKASFGFMAQNEDDAVQRHLDMRWATITKLIDTTQKMIDVKMRLADSMVGNRMCDELRMSVLKMMEKIEKWNEEMEQMMEEKRESNPIVGRVLEHAARSMGLAVPSTNRRTDVTLATVGSGLGVATITTTTGGTSKNDDETDLFV